MPPQKSQFDINKGIVQDTRVMQAIVPRLDHGPLRTIHAIVVHQTDSSNAKGTLAFYARDPKEYGAHFLIDKDGTIYQTVPITRKAQHVGPILSKCFAVHNCTIDQGKQLATAAKKPNSIMARHNVEMQKPYPDRYPFNGDSIGIEIVGKWLGDKQHPDVVDYEAPTPQEQQSLQWLVTHLMKALSLTPTDVYRHPQISRKTSGEARDAAW